MKLVRKTLAESLLKSLAPAWLMTMYAIYSGHCALCPGFSKHRLAQDTTVRATGRRTVS
jgi:hypothetical protein